MSIKQTEGQAFEVEFINAEKWHNITLDLGHALDRVAGVRVRESCGIGSRMNISLSGFNGRQNSLSMVFRWKISVHLFN